MNGAIAAVTGRPSEAAAPGRSVRTWRRVCQCEQRCNTAAVRADAKVGVHVGHQLQSRLTKMEEREKHLARFPLHGARLTANNDEDNEINRNVMKR